MAVYTRQSSSGIVDGGVIEASDLNAEFDQLASAFLQPTFVISASLKEVAPRVFEAAVDVIPPDAVINCEAFTVNAVEPPVVTVITSEPLNVMLVFVSASPAMESSCTAPTLDNAASPKSTAPATVSVPDTSTLPFMSMVVAVRSISVSATKFK